MTPRIRKVAAIVSTTVLLGGASAAAQAATGKDATTAAAQRAGHRGPGGMPAAALDAIAAKLGVTTTRLEAAMEANRPARPAGGRRGDGMAAQLASELGVKTDAVADILAANRPAAPARDTKPSDTDLVAALATGLELDNATVQAAVDKLRAAHEARHAAEYAAIAKTLGVRAADVESAFDAARPARPAA